MPENEFAAAAQTDAAAATGTAGLPDPNATTNAPDDQAATAANDQAVTEIAAQPENPDENEEITYHAVQKDNAVTAIWEMQGRKHLRTIDPRSREGAEILSLFSAEEGEEQAA